VTWLNSLDPAKAEHRFVLRMAIAPALRHYLVDKIINPYLASEEPQGIMLRDLANFYNRGDTNMTTPRVLGFDISLYSPS